MSNPQGSQGINAAYFGAMAARAAACSTCDELTSLSVNVNGSVGATLSAVSAQLSDIQTSEENVANDIAAISAEIETMTGSETAFAALNGLSSLAATAATATPTNLAPIIAYIQGNANLLVSLGNAGQSTFLASAARLAKDVIKLTRDLDALQAQIASLTALVTEMPQQLATVNAAISVRAGAIPGCTVP